MTRSRISWVLIVVAGMGSSRGSTAVEEARGQAVAPGQDYTSPMFYLRAPKSEGWVELGQNKTQIAFGRSGATALDSDIAAVMLYRVPRDIGDEAFGEMVRAGVEKDSPSPRFDVSLSEFTSLQDRPYACISYRGKSTDHGKRSLLGRTSPPLELRVMAIYCKYPGQPGLAFTVSFSHRGPAVPESFDLEARSFIDGVQVLAQAQPNKSLERSRDR